MNRPTTKAELETLKLRSTLEIVCLIIQCESDYTGDFKRMLLGMRYRKVFPCERDFWGHLLKVAQAITLNDDVVRSEDSYSAIDRNSRIFGSMAYGRAKIAVEIAFERLEKIERADVGAKE